MKNILAKRNFTRITALLLAVAVIFGTMFALPVSAASGDKVTITFDYCYDSTGNISNFSRQQSATATRSELPEKSCARFLQTEKKPTALNLVIHSTQAIR